MGNFFLIQGITEPGADVTVNGGVGGGRGRRQLQEDRDALSREGMNTIVVVATDPAGNTTEYRETVFVEGD